MHHRSAHIAHAKPEDEGSRNPDPTMQKPAGSPKGENMPPRGGEDIAPEDSSRSPAAMQKQMKDDAKKAQS